MTEPEPLPAHGRFVILNHDHPFEHWDLMLESGDCLLTWRLMTEPAASSVVESQRLPDHRIEYLDYEGPVSGNRGTVSQWDSGTFERDGEGTHGTVRLSGQRVHCTLTVSETSCTFG